MVNYRNTHKVRVVEVSAPEDGKYANTHPVKVYVEGGGGGGGVTVDDHMSTTSENPVQNKVITRELNKKQGKLTKGDYIEIIEDTISVITANELSEEDTKPIENATVAAAIKALQDAIDGIEEPNIVYWSGQVSQQTEYPKSNTIYINNAMDNQTTMPWSTVLGSANARVDATKLGRYWVIYVSRYSNTSAIPILAIGKNVMMGLANAGGWTGNVYPLPDGIRNNLTATTTGSALDANQGRVLNETKLGVDKLTGGTGINISTSGSGAETALSVEIDPDATLDGESGNAVANSAVSSAISDINDGIDAIEGKIPTQATSQNQLADKAFVNSTVQTGTANYRGAWADWSSVPTDGSLYPADYANNHNPTVNDYLVVQDASGFSVSTTGTWRFKYSGTWSEDGKTGWLAEYQVNEEPLTAAQIAALDSGITSGLVSKITTNETNIGQKLDKTTTFWGRTASNGAVSGVINMGSSKITNLADATANSDAVNLGQMNTAITTAISEITDFDEESF